MEQRPPMKTLQELLETKVTSKNIDGDTSPEFSPDFRVAVQAIHDDGVHIIIHPMSHNGETLDLMVRGNTISMVGQVNEQSQNA